MNPTTSINITTITRGKLTELKGKLEAKYDRTFSYDEVIIYLIEMEKKET